MDVQEKEALQILQGAFWVNPDDHLKEFKTKYRKWLLQVYAAVEKSLTGAAAWCC
jgi:hypothetical protein